MAKLKAPDNCGGFSHQGEEFKVIKGYITIPDDNMDAIMASLSHGFRTTGKTDAENDAEAEVLATQEAIAAQERATAEAEAAAVAQAAAIAEQDRVARELVEAQAAAASAKAAA